MSAPDYVGIGAADAGGGWWHRLLRTHPQCAPAGPAGWVRRGRAAARWRALRPPDLAAFATRPVGDADVARYRAAFARPAGTAAGAWSSALLASPWGPATLARLAPDARLIVLLEDPISAYRRDAERRRLRQLADGSAQPTAIAVAERLHAAQLQLWWRWFAPERTLVLQREHCRADPEGQLRRTWRFLGLPADVPVAPLPRHVPWRVRYQRGLRRTGVPAQSAVRLSRTPLADVAPRPLWPELEQALHTALDPDVRRLAELVPGLDLARWPHFEHLSPT